MGKLNRWSRWFLSTALIILTTVGFFSPAAFAKVQSSVSTVTFAMSTLVGGAASTWTEDFKTSAGGALTANVGTMTVTGPTNTAFPAMAADVYVNGTVVTTITAGGGTNSFTFDTPVGVGNSASVDVVVYGVQNPLAGTDANTNFSMSTSADTQAANPATGETFTPSAVSGVTFALSSLVGQATATWTEGFTTSNVGTLAPNAGTITVTGPGGTVFPNAAADVFVNGNVATTITAGGGSNSFTFDTPVPIDNQAAVQVVVYGVQNPSAGNYAAVTFSMATSADTLAANPATGQTFTAAPQVAKGNNGDIGSGGPNPNPPIGPNTTAQGTFGCAGGTVATADGSVSVTVPAGAFCAGNATVSIQAVSEAQVVGGPAYFASTGLQWSISAGGAQPSLPVTVTFKYDASALGGLNPARVGVYFLNQTTGVWTWIGGTVDPSAGTITVTLPHFSQYAVFANTETFGDLSGAAWAKSAIDALLGASIINGTGPGVFDPSGTLTRAQFTKLLVLADGLTPGGSTAFSDVAANAWYAPYVAAAARAGLVQGTSTTTFDPNGSLSRQEMAVMLARLLGGGSPAAGGAATFTDGSQIAPWAQVAVAAATGAGLLTGFPDGAFQPAGTTTRAQAAQVVYKYLLHVGKV